MAKLLKNAYPITQPNWNNSYGSNESLIEKQEAEMEDLFKKSEKAQKEGKIEGLLWGFPVGDGAAWYLVTKADPLTLQWVPYMDAWRAPDYVIRGLRKGDL